MITMGIDASTSKTGWSIFNGSELVTYGVIKPKGTDLWRDRIQQEWNLFCEIVEKYKPEKIFAEDVPLKDGKITLVKLGAVQGLMLALSANFDIPITFFSPSDWREPMGLYDGTRAGTHREVLKEKAIKMANKKFGLDLKWVAPKSTKNDDDVAEAILIAYSQVKPKFFGK